MKKRERRSEVRASSFDSRQLFGETKRQREQNAFLSRSLEEERGQRGKEIAKCHEGGQLLC